MKWIFYKRTIIFLSSTIKIILVSFCISLISCKDINSINNPSFQPAGENYKWWSEQKEKEVTKWSVRRDENILWKVPLEETGQSGIIRVGDLLFLSIMRPVYDTITKRGTDILALCYNAITGEKVWQKEILGSHKRQ